MPTHPTYRKGTGPGVVVIAEIPGITAEVVAFAEEVVAQGFTVVLPHLFGDVPSASGPGAAVRTLATVCVNREFTKLRLRETSPVATWLRSLARALHAELGGPGVGAVGMCFTGGFALAMMVDESVAAPVVAQPSLPFPIGKERAADLNLSPADLERRTLTPGGSIYGSSSNGARAAFLRPQNASPVPGVYLVGGSSHPGGGLPLVMLSGKIVADLVDR